MDRRLRAVLLCLSLSLTLTAAERQPTRRGEILWDKFGVPHIFAASTTSMFYLFGYAEVEAHGDLLLHTLGQSRGRGAEYFGPGHQDAHLKTDRWIWLNEIPARAAGWLARQTPEFRGYLDAFAAGINAAASKPGAVSDEVRQVLPITALDLIEHEQHFYNFEFVANRSLMAPPAPRGESATAQLRPAAFEPSPEDIADGSNGWAIGPAHSSSGKSMLLMNPHLAWGGESTYFEIHLTAPGVDLYGATQIGVPSLRFVMSDHHAITNTVNTNNGRLLYRIVEAPGGYKFDGKVIPYGKASYPIRIKQPDGSFKTETLEVLKTVHGPVIRRDTDGSPIALWVAGLDRPFLLDQVYRMSVARTFAEYQTQLKRQQIPMYNILYADREGHIEYLFNAAVPRRSEGDWAFWSRPVPGDTSRLLPKGTLSYDELPKLIDPPSGYVQNSNEPPWDAGWPTMLKPSDYPPYVAPTGASFRSDRSLRMLSEDPKISFEMLLTKKLSTRAEAADRLLPDLLSAVETYGSARAKRAAEVLKAWDRQAEADSRGTLLFWTWATRFGMPGPAPASAHNFAQPIEVDKPLTTPSGLRDPKAAVDLLDAAAEALEKKYGALDKPWGEFLRLQLNQQSAGPAAAAKRGAPLNGIDLPGNGGPGAIGIFRVVTPGPEQGGTATPVHGDGFTLAVEYSQPMKVKALVSYGDCSQPECKHHTDQLQLFENKQWRDVWRTRKAVEANLERAESF
ncbi:MAG: penicillin acylase family protein [Acidobacteria bacterium]|nr:penicillin acylase family protein [Acidobacteriota bacterium]